MLDRFLALILLLPGLPAITFFVALVKLTSPGPGIFRQRRVGKGGKIFTMYKIRTMGPDAESATGPVWTSSDDPRITRIGSFLRHWHLDELPQLFNVLKGEMSVIGPRPERPEFVRVLIDYIPNYTDRLAVLPGITGLAQINLPPDTDIDSVRRKQALDCEYIRTANLWLESRILTWTAFRLLGISCVLAARLTSLTRSVSLERPVDSPPPTPIDSLTPQKIARPQSLTDTVSVAVSKTIAAPIRALDDHVGDQNGKARAEGSGSPDRDASNGEVTGVDSPHATSALLRPSKKPK